MSEVKLPSGAWEYMLELASDPQEDFGKLLKGFVIALDKQVIPCGEIILNRIHCNYCGVAVTSHHRHDYVSCGCEMQCSADGGRAYLKRSYKRLDSDGSLPYTDLSVTSSASFEDVRNVLFRGTFDEKGNRIYKALRDIDDDHLLNIITYCAENLQTETLDFKYYQMEALFRGLNGKDN